MDTAPHVMATLSTGSRPPVPRKRFHVHQIQTTYAVWIGALLFIYSILLFGAAFVIPYLVPAMKLISSAPIEERALAARQFLALSPAIGPALIALIVGAAFFSIFLTHRLAGPLYRLEKCAKELSEGNLSIRIRLRKRDELQELARLLDETVVNLDQAMGELRNREITSQTALRRLADLLKTQPATNPDVTKQLEIALAEGVQKKNVLTRFRLSDGQ